jgi:hypothetical protein
MFNPNIDIVCPTDFPEPVCRCQCDTCSVRHYVKKRLEKEIALLVTAKRVKQIGKDPLMSCYFEVRTFCQSKNVELGCDHITHFNSLIGQIAIASVRFVQQLVYSREQDRIRLNKEPMQVRVRVDY